MNHCDMYPSLRRFRERFVILAQPSAASEPRQRSFNYPPSGQQRKLMAATRSSDDFQHISSNCLRPVNQPTGVARISPNQPQTPKPPHHLRNDQLRPISVLYVSRVDHNGQQHPHSIYDDVSLSTLDLLASVIAARPPFSVVFTDWLSMIAALGSGSLPADLRTARRSVSLTRAQVPSSLHSLKYHQTVPQGGKSCGNARQEHPFLRTYRMPLTTSLMSALRGLPPALAAGSKGASTFHCSSLKSLGYGFLFMPLV